MAEQGDSNVVPLHPGSDGEDSDRPLITKPRDGTFCRHKKTWVDKEARRLYCRDCGREVPAFDVLLELATDTEYYIQHRDRAARESRLADAALKEAKRLERNAKSRVRNAVARAPGCCCDERVRLAVSRYAGPWCPTCGGRR